MLTNCWRVCVLVSVLPFLNGCLPAMIVGQVAPVVFGGVAMANVDDRSPFKIHKPNAKPAIETDLAKLDAQIRQAECGDPQSQFWVASALQNGFNSTPNSIEIYKWYRLAEIGNYSRASKELEALDATMSESEISAARDRVQAWRPATEGCSVSS